MRLIIVDWKENRLNNATKITVEKKKSNSIINLHYITYDDRNIYSYAQQYFLIMYCELHIHLQYIIQF